MNHIFILQLTNYQLTSSFIIVRILFYHIFVTKLHIQNYLGYFLHLGPLHRLHLPHPRSIVPAPADFLALALSLAQVSALLSHTETIVSAFFRIHPFWIFYPFSYLFYWKYPPKILFLTYRSRL